MSGAVPLIRRVGTVSLAAVFVMAGLFFPWETMTYAQSSNEQLIQCSSPQTGVYVVIRGVRFGIPDPANLAALGFSFSNVQQVSNSQMNSYPTTPTALPNGTLIQAPAVNQDGTPVTGVFVIIDGVRFGVPDPANLSAIAGSSPVIYPIPYNDLMAIPTSASALPNGTLLQAPGVSQDGTPGTGVFVVMGGQRYGVASPTALAAIGGSFSNVNAIPYTDLMAIPAGPGPSISVGGSGAGTYSQGTSQSITFQASSSGPAVSGIAASWDSPPSIDTMQGGTSGAVSLSSLSPGTHTLYIEAWNAAGDASPIAQVGPFTINQPAAPPAITGFSPTLTASSTAQWLTISGSGFQPGASVVLNTDGVNYPVSGVQVSNSNTIRIDLNTSAQGAGTWMAQVTNPDGQRSNVLPFHVNAPFATAVGSTQGVNPKLLDGSLVTISGGTEVKASANWSGLTSSHADVKVTLTDNLINPPSPLPQVGISYFVEASVPGSSQNWYAILVPGLTLTTPSFVLNPEQHVEVKASLTPFNLSPSQTEGMTALMGLADTLSFADGMGRGGGANLALLGRHLIQVGQGSSQNLILNQIQGQLGSFVNVGTDVAHGNVLALIQDLPPVAAEAPDWLPPVLTTMGVSDSAAVSAAGIVGGMGGLIGTAVTTGWLLGDAGATLVIGAFLNQGTMITFSYVPMQSPPIPVVANAVHITNFIARANGLIEVTGQGFGSQQPQYTPAPGENPSPFAGDTRVVSIRDETSGWDAGQIGNVVALSQGWWTPTSLGFGMAGGYLANNWVMKPGNVMQITLDIGGNIATATTTVPAATINSTRTENVSPVTGGVTGSGWTMSSSGGNAVTNGKSWYAKSVSGAFTAWTHFANPEAENSNIGGNYSVRMWVPSGDANAAPVTYNIWHNGTMSYVRINQAPIFGWVNLGTYWFGNGHKAYVGVNNNTGTSGQLVGVAAVQFVYQGQQAE